MKNFTTIKKRSEILAAKRYNNKIYNQYFNISYTPIQGIKPSILIISTKKNCASSVQRNLLKRRLKEIFFNYNKNYLFPYNLVIYNKDKVFTANFSTIEKGFLDLLKKI